MAIHRVTLRWQGFPGAPGYSNFFFQGAADASRAAASRGRVVSFVNEVIEVVAGGVGLTVEDEVATFDEASGALTGYASAGSNPVAAVAGGSGAYSGPSGGVISWNTDTVRGNRRVRGRTFIVPMKATAYDSDGSLSAAAIAALNDAAGELLQGGSPSGFGVWSRPGVNGAGVFALVTSYRVPDLAAVLRSRRD